MKLTCLQAHFYRRLCSNVIALALAVLAGYFLDRDQSGWAMIGAILAMPTTRGTPVRQGLILLIAGLFAVVMGCVLAYCFLGISWSPAAQQMLQTKLLLMIAGGVITIVCGLVILPIRQYQEFRRAMLPMLDALIRYSTDLSRVLQGGGAVEASLLDIPYPEWVFEAGFNRNFRGSFRYVLIQLDRVIEALFSLDYYIHQTVDIDMRADVAKPLTAVVEKNTALLAIIRAFFANEKDDKVNDNYISDMTDLHNVLLYVLPQSLELLDVSTDFTILSSMVRDVTDIRELLLQILAGLPIDALVMGEA